MTVMGMGVMIVMGVITVMGVINDRNKQIPIFFQWLHNYFTENARPEEHIIM